MCKTLHIVGSMIAAKPHLTGPELVAALEARDMEQIELGRLVDVNGSTAKRWVSGATDVPGCATLLVRLLLARPELKELIGARARSGLGRPPIGSDQRRRRPRTGR